MCAERYFQTGQGRVFLQDFGAGPIHLYDYLGCARLTGFSEALGDVTAVKCPSPDGYDRFQVVDEVKGEGGLPTTSLIARFGLTNQIFEQECPFDIQAHYGKCEDPTDFNGGWEKIIAFEKARFTTRSSEDLTALEEGERASILLTGEITARELFEIDPLVLGEAAGAEVTREVIAVAICDFLSCGECGWESLGCNRIYAITLTSALDSPGLPAELIWSEDGGATWQQVDIPTLANDESPSDLACVGQNVVVVSQDSGSLHYAPVSDLEDWHEVAEGFVDDPLAIFSLSATQTWIVGDLGYVYFSEDVTTGVSIQDDGVAAGNDQLNDVQASSSQHVVAVGNDNTVIYTLNGGLTWAAMVGPAPGVNLNCIWMRTQHCWYIGTANGRLYYTVNAGADWDEKNFPGSGEGEVHDIVFSVRSDSSWGFLAHSTAAAEGRILRSLDGGASWYILPEGLGAIPANDYIGSLAVCRDPNFVVGGGLGDDGVDGIIVIGA